MSTTEAPIDETRDPAEEREERRRDFLRLVDAYDTSAIQNFLTELHPSDVADLLEELDEDDRVFVISLLPAEVASEALTEMESEEHPEELLAALEPDRIGELIAELSADDAVDLIGELEPEEQDRVLATLSHLEAGELRRLLQYDEESAGGIMTTELVAVPVSLTAGDAIREVRRQAQEIGGEFYTIFAVDQGHRLVGTVSLRDLVVTDPATPLEQLVEPPVASVPVDMDQEDVGRIIAKYNLPSIGVVGPKNVLLGRITWDDVIDVMELEQTEDIFHLAGVGSEEEIRGGWWDAVRSRLPWLGLNLGTAALAAAVVYSYQETIEQAVILAAIMPVIAGLGGNAGTQALAVTVRRLALTDESAARRWRVVAKELLVGVFNGAALGLLVGTISYFWIGEPMLGLVVLMAMWGNLLIASMAGAFVPITLERFGADPAVASSVFVTAATDMGGFFLLLGLASKLLL